jgi:hypothetical protein
MEEVTTGRTYIDGIAVATFELTRTFESRPVPIAAAHQTIYRDLGGERQAFIEFPDIYCPELRARLQRMIDAQVSVDERRRLRDEGKAGVALVLEQEDGSGLDGAVGPPLFAHQPADRTRFPISLRT